MILTAGRQVIVNASACSTPSPSAIGTFSTRAWGGSAQ
jgi:hypothetical protein